MSLQHIQKNSPGLLPKPAKFEKNPPNGYRVIRKTKCGAGGAGGARSSPIHKQASLAGRLMILLHGESCNFSTTLPNMADGGKVYAFRSYHGRLSASTAVARGSGTGDTNTGNLLLNLVANKSIWAGATCCIEWKTSGRRNHCLDGLA